MAIALAFPLAAAAVEPTEAVVPPENSAASQYTEAFPTAGGDKQAGGSRNSHRSPAKVLGAGNAHRLESQGKQGREAAKVVAATAPGAGASPGESSQHGVHSAQEGASAGRSPTGPGSRTSSQGTGNAGSSHAGSGASQQALPAGSSGFGEVVRQATGSSSSGQLGAFLPLAILAAILWSLVYFWRRRSAGTT